jgi:uncharacterized protein involved in outer membrane biogenesis
MRVVLKLLAWVAGVLVVLAAGAYAYLRNADLSVYEVRVERLLSDATGLDIDFQGRFRLRFGQSSTISVERIVITNPDHADAPQLVDVSTFRLALDTWSLIRRPIVIDELSVGAAAVVLHQAEDGRANWQSAKQQGRPSESAEPPEIPVPRDVSIRNFDLQFIDESRPVPIDLSLQTLQITPDDQAILGLTVDGEINQYPLSITGQLGPLPALISGREVAANVELMLGELRLDLDGSIEDALRMDGVQAAVILEGPRTERFVERFGLPPVAEGAFSLAGEVGRASGVHDIRLIGNIGRITVDVQGTVDNFREFSAVDIDYAVTAPESLYVTEMMGLDDPARTAFSISGGLGRDKERFDIRQTSVAIGRGRIDVDGWVRQTGGVPDFSLRLDGTGPDLSVFEPLIGRGGLPAETFSFSGRLDKSGSALSFDNVDFRVGANTVAASGQVDGRGNPENRIDFRASGPDLSVFREISGVEGLPARPFDVSADLVGGQNGVRVRSASARVGPNAVTGDGVLVLDADWAGTRLTVRADGPDLADVPVLAGIPHMPSTPFSLDAEVEVDRRRLTVSRLSGDIGGLQIQADAQLARDVAEIQYAANVTLSGRDLARDIPLDVLQRVSGRAFDVSASLAGIGSRLTIADGSGNLDGLRFRVDASIDTANPLLSDHFDVELNAPDAETVRALADLDYLPAGEFRLVANVDTTGDSFLFNNVSLGIGDLAFAVNGELGKSRPYSGNDIAVSASGGSLQDVGRIFSDEYFADEPFRLDARFDGTETGLDLEDFALSVGDNSVTGAMSIDVSQSVPALDIRLSSPYLDMRERVQKFIDRQEAGTEAPAASRREAGRVFSTSPLELDWLTVIDLDLLFEAERMVTQTGDLTGVRVGVEILDGNLKIDPLTGSSARGLIDGSMTLTRERGVYTIDATLFADDVRPPILAAEGLDPQAVPPIDADIRLRGEGISEHEILAGADGHLFLYMDSGQAAAFGSRLLTGSLGTAIFSAIIPASQRPTYTNVNCGVVDIDIVDGLATLRQVVAQTNQLTTLGSGTIDLDTERLRLNIRTQPREGLGIPSLAGVINPFVRVAGTLASPSLEIDPASSVTSTGVAVATGGLSILARGVWDRMRGGADLCRSIPKTRPDRAPGQE